MQVTVQVRNLDAAIEKLNMLDLAMADLARVVAELVRGQTVKRIAQSKQSPEGVKWAALAASTIARKRKGAGILVNTGRLLGSINADVVGIDARVSTNLKYAGWLQDGTKKMPARPFIGLGPKDEKEIVSAVQAFIEDLLG